MPGPQHDAANDLVREHPDLVLRLLRDVGGVDLPDTVPLQVHSGELNDRISTNRHADTLILAGPPHDPWYGLICEIETRLSREKILQALRYANTVWLRLDKPVYVLFITPDRNADRLAHPASVSAGGLAITLTPCICGPNQIPVITDPAQVEADPALATVSVMNHGDRKEVAETFLTGLNSLDSDDAARYYEYAFNMAASTAKRIMEAVMATTAWPVYSPFAKEHFGKGVAEGKAKGKADAVVAVLESRGLTVTSDQKARIEGTTDQARLDGWLSRVASVASTEELLKDV